MYAEKKDRKSFETGSLIVKLFTLILTVFFYTVAIIVAHREKFVKCTFTS
jgi:hypothetical protein